MPQRRNPPASLSACHPALQEKIKKVAYLMTIPAADGRRTMQTAVAARLGMSHLEVCRIVKEARRLKVLLDDPRWGLPEEEAMRIELQVRGVPELAAALAEETRAAGVPPVRLRVFDARPETHDQPPEYEDALTVFAPGIARYLLDNVFPFTRTAAVSWGRTLFAVLRALRTVANRESHRQPIRFLPLAGEPLNIEAHIGHSSTLHAAAMNDIINDRHGRPNSGASPEVDPNPALSLGAVPASIPADFRGRDIAVVHRFIHGIAAYNKIFGPRYLTARQDCRTVGQGEIDSVDTVLTAVGTTLAKHKDQWDHWLVDAARAIGKAPKHLEKISLGNISGVFLHRPGSPRAKQEVDEINARWTGICEQHLKDCVRRAARDQRPGVVVMAAGREKAELVVECVRRGLVSQLALDLDLAAATRDLLHAQTSARNPA